MPRKPDPFDDLPRDQQLALMRAMVGSVLGPKVGDIFWKQAQPAVANTLRQPGDAADPEKSFWGGVWRIHDAS